MMPALWRLTGGASYVLDDEPQPAPSRAAALGIDFRGYSGRAPGAQCSRSSGSTPRPRPPPNGGSATPPRLGLGQPAGKAGTRGGAHCPRRTLDPAPILSGGEPVHRAGAESRSLGRLVRLPGCSRPESCRRPAAVRQFCHPDTDFGHPDCLLRLPSLGWLDLRGLPCMFGVLALSCAECQPIDHQMLRSSKPITRWRSHRWQLLPRLSPA